MAEDPKAKERCRREHDADPPRHSADEVEDMSAPASKSVKLNTQLHAQLSRSGKVKPSTFEAAMAALERLRRTRGG